MSRTAPGRDRAILISPAVRNPPGKDPMLLKLAVASRGDLSIIMAMALEAPRGKAQKIFHIRQSRGKAQPDARAVFFQKIVFVALIFFVCGWAAPAVAGDSLPLKTVKELLKTIKAIREDNGSLTREDRARNKALKERANALVDIQWLSRWTLGTYWEKRSTAEKKEMRKLLGEIFKNVAYPKSGKFFRGLGVTYDAERRKGEKAVITTTIIHKKEGEIEIAYKLRSDEGQWRVYDVSMDGVSLGRNLKSKFLKIIRKESYAELIRRLKKKLAEKEISGGLL